MASDEMLFQISSIVALIGMALGWRGVMTRFSGFYDLPTAWNQIFWGILIGGICATLADNFLFSPFASAVLTGDSEGNSISNLIVILMISIAVHMMLRRERVRKTGSQPTSGWALGLAIGAMTGMYLIFRTLQIHGFTFESVLTVLLIGLIAPRAEALICTFHGYRMLDGERWKVVIRSFIIRTIYIGALYFAVFNILAWIFIIPFILLAEKNAEKWVWAAVPKPARRRLRRIWAEKARSNKSEEE